MSLITLKHGNRHVAGGSDPISIADLFDGISSSEAAAARLDLGVAPLLTGSKAQCIADGSFIGPAGRRGNATQAINEMPLIPVALRAGTLDRIGVHAYSGVASLVGRLVIYNDDAGRPGTLLLDAGTVDLSSSGVKTITISQAVDTAIYWMGCVMQVGASICSIEGRNFDVVVAGSTNYMSTQFYSRGFVQTGVSGAAPSTFTTSPTYKLESFIGAAAFVRYSA